MQSSRKLWLRIGAASAVAIVLSGCVTTPTVDDAAKAQQQFQSATVLMQQNKHAEAKTALLALQPFRTKDPRVLASLAAASDMTGDFRTADRAYTMLSESSFDRVTLWNNWGYSQMLRGNYQKAAFYLFEAQRLAPNNEAVANNIGMLKKVTVL